MTPKELYPQAPNRLKHMTPLPPTPPAPPAPPHDPPSISSCSSRSTTPSSSSSSFSSSTNPSISPTLNSTAPPFSRHHKKTPSSSSSTPPREGTTTIITTTTTVTTAQNLTGVSKSPCPEVMGVRVDMGNTGNEDEGVGDSLDRCGKGMDRESEGKANREREGKETERENEKVMEREINGKEMDRESEKVDKEREEKDMDIDGMAQRLTPLANCLMGDQIAKVQRSSPVELSLCPVTQRTQNAETDTQTPDILRGYPRELLHSCTQPGKDSHISYSKGRTQTQCPVEMKDSLSTQCPMTSQNPLLDLRMPGVKDPHTQRPSGLKNPLLQAGKDLKDAKSLMATQNPFLDHRMQTQESNPCSEDLKDSATMRDPTVTSMSLRYRRGKGTRTDELTVCHEDIRMVSQSKNRVPDCGMQIEVDPNLCHEEFRTSTQSQSRVPHLPQTGRDPREDLLTPTQSENRVPDLMQTEADPNLCHEEFWTSTQSQSRVPDLLQTGPDPREDLLTPTQSENRVPDLMQTEADPNLCHGEFWTSTQSQSRVPDLPQTGRDSLVCRTALPSTVQSPWVQTPLLTKDQTVNPKELPYPKDTLRTSNPRGTTFSIRCPGGGRRKRGASVISLGVKLSLVTLLLAGVATGSEFPDRECCDSVPPPPPNYHQATSTTTTTTPAPPPGTARNTSIVTVSRGASGVINCIEARHQCRNDGQCRDVLDMLHKICGPELVACATVTPGKCKTLLRTLGQYDYMKSCTCREPHIDFNCYTFREMIFSHPCILVDTPGDSQQFMPTCTQADADCKQSRACVKSYMEFVNYCGYSGITCTSQQSDKCNESWQRIRMSPHFGCYCPPQMRAVRYSGQRGPYDTAAATSSSDEDKCMINYNTTHENPCLAGQQDVDRAKMVQNSQAMCHKALESCQNDPQCSQELDNINTWCDHSHCEPDRCRNALQDFYQRVKVVRRLQVAFCVCRQSDHDGECLMAMRRLHPTCAERHTPRDPMQCHKIAEQCRKNRVCSAKLQEYEQKCAADAMTGLCSDTHRSCQQAVMNILGTELHATCVCKGTDFLHQQDCYTWQKLLWSNPCVIESHLKLHEEIDSGAADDLDEEFRRMTPAPPTSTPAPHHGPPTSYDPEHKGGSNHDFGIIMLRPDGEEESNWGRMRGGGGGLIGGSNRGTYIGPPGGHRGKFDPPGGYKGEGRPRPDAEGHFRSRGNGGNVIFGRPTNAIPNGGVWPGGPYNRGPYGSHRGTGIAMPSDAPSPWDWDSRGHGRRPGGYLAPDRSEEGEVGYPEGGVYKATPRTPIFRQPYNPAPHTPAGYMPVTPTPPGMPPTRPADPASTPAAAATTTAPTRACTMKDRDYKTVVIPEGSSKRLFKGDSDCSELCTCPEIGRGNEPEAKCIALSCMQNKACNTSRANYPHTAPYYLAFRGVCLCYGGRFICQKPEPGEYTLGPGIYLFLGYSRGEVEILKPYTSMNEHEAVKVLENVLVRDYDFQCELTTKHHIGENFIVVAKLQMNPDTYISPFVKQRREKVCAGPLEEIAKKINSRPRHEDIRTDAILSMFVLAKVDVNLPEPHTSPSHASTPPHALPAVLLTLLGAHLLIRTLLLPLTPST
ncbi:uncharacterized protein LOC126984453 isoform X2 [Eriocheir sinensis]|uniref:uncharacterized protein LOC126984453 isoform X2 n=1 Tax=Eriocheir sinensis TaxID=95602 RepID=UPI0021CADB28|nr:uncharacterized protein LOC126984453 isoform X2 [Eriocheir sinensis]